MSVLEIEYGQQPKFTLRCTDNDTDDLFDPDDVYFTVKRPDGTKDTYHYGDDSEVDREAEGIFFFAPVADQWGTWYVRGWYSGAANGSDEMRMHVSKVQALEVED